MTRDACPEYVPLLVRAGDGSIAPADLDRLLRHTASCEGCRAALATQQLVHGALAAQPRAAAVPGFAARVVRAIEREAPAPWWERFDSRRWTWRLAPVTAALAIAAFAWQTSSTSTADAAPLVTGGATSSVATAALATDETAPDEVMSLMLFADPDTPLADALQEIPQ
ncbi:MAG: hypothetical protein IT184_01020 [Acidobacteria bacterium]|nr:hypothetical protein [Acidobacteriota bacterium]